MDDEESGGVLLQASQRLPAATSKQSAANRSANPVPATAPASTNTECRFVLVEGVESSYNMGTKSPSTDRPYSSAALPSIDLTRGHLTAPQHHFTPIVAIAKYPYKFCNKSHSQEIASAFFDAGKFWNREWDL
jgi:hypothetical protein